MKQAALDKRLTMEPTQPDAHGHAVAHPVQRQIDSSPRQVEQKKQLALLRSEVESDVSPAADRGSPVQLMRVREHPGTFLGTNVTKDRIRAYFYEYEIPKMVEYVEGYGMDPDANLAVTTSYATYKSEFQRNAMLQAPTWPAVVGILDTLVTNINTALGHAAATLPTGYEASTTGNWDGEAAAVRAANAQVNGTPAVATQNGQAAGIRTIPYSAVRETFPVVLFRLIRDIYGSWRSGQVMDERTPTEQTNAHGHHTLNSNRPGALRSWHMNTEGSLPATDPGAVPANAAALHAHYQATSGVMNILGAAQGPNGYAEYTGTGIMNDAHFSKIVLDYKRGFLFLTLTHYQYWRDAGGNVTSEGQVTGTNNPWFKIDMNS